MVEKPQKSEMDILREELLNDPNVQIGKNVLRDWELEKAEREKAERDSRPG